MPNPSATTQQQQCPQCKQRPLNAPTVCHGHYKAENEGRFYERCSANNLDIPEQERQCTYFRWRDDISSRLPEDLRCQGPDCQRRIGGPKQMNRQCSRAQKACAGCCRKLGLSGDYIECSVSGHRTPMPPPPPNQLIVNPPPKNSVDKTTSAAAPSSLPSDPKACSAPVQSSSYAKILPSSWEAKYAENQATFGTSVASGANSHLQSQYRRDVEGNVTVLWWTQNTDGPLKFVVSPLTRGYFHPQDSNTMKEVLTVAVCKQFYAFTSSGWAITPLAQAIPPSRVLLFRSLSVQTCLDPENIVPAQYKKSLANSPAHLSRLAGQSSSAPLHKSQSTVIDVSDDEDHTDTEPKVSPSVVKVSPLYSLALSKEAESPTQSTVSSTTRVKVLSNATVATDLSNAESKRANSWPLQWTCDMDQGFREMERRAKDAKRLRSAENKPSTAKDLFPAVWGANRDYVKSTYSDHQSLWTEIRGNSDFRDALRCGRNAGGEWSTLYRKFARKKSPKKKDQVVIVLDD